MMIESVAGISAKFLMRWSTSGAIFFCRNWIILMKAWRTGRAEKKRTPYFRLLAWLDAPCAKRASEFGVLEPAVRGSAVGAKNISDVSVSFWICDQGESLRIFSASF